MKDEMGLDVNVLRLFRIAKDMSVKELADKMGVRQSFISDIEHGTRNATLQTYQRYSKALNIPLSTIMFFDEKKMEKGNNYRKLLISILQKVEKLEEKKNEYSNTEEALEFDETQ